MKVIAVNCTAESSLLGPPCVAHRIEFCRRQCNRLWFLPARGVAQPTAEEYPVLKLSGKALAKLKLSVKALAQLKVNNKTLAMAGLG